MEKITTLWDVQQYLGTRHVATLHWQKPYPLALHLKKLAEKTKHPPRTYFKLSENKTPKSC